MFLPSCSSRSVGYHRTRPFNRVRPFPFLTFLAVAQFPRQEKSPSNSSFRPDAIALRAPYCILSPHLQSINCVHLRGIVCVCVCALLHPEKKAHWESRLLTEPLRVGDQNPPIRRNTLKCSRSSSSNHQHHDQQKWLSAKTSQKCRSNIYCTPPSPRQCTLFSTSTVVFRRRRDVCVYIASFPFLSALDCLLRSTVLCRFAFPSDGGLFSFLSLRLGVMLKFS